MKFLHLSDLHICADDNIPNTAGFNNKETKKILNFIKNNRAWNKHVIIITGDVTDNQLNTTIFPESEFNRAFELLKPFRGRLLICPGNHDFAILGNKFNPASPPFFDKFIQKLVRFDNNTTFGWPPAYAGRNSYPQVSSFSTEFGAVLTYGLDTCRERFSPGENVLVTPPWGGPPIPQPIPTEFARGEIGDFQMRNLEQLMFTLPPRTTENPRLVYMHHHPFEHTNETMILTDRERFCRTVANKIDVVLFGHKHQMARYSDKYGVYLWLASGASPKDKKAWEITIHRSLISATEVALQ